MRHASPRQDRMDIAASQSEDAQASVSIEMVLQTIQAALSNDNTVRSLAEAALKSWEGDAAPGFLVSLLRIVEQHQAIDMVRNLRRRRSLYLRAWVFSGPRDLLGLPGCMGLNFVQPKSLVGGSLAPIPAIPQMIFHII